jgi:hypothetical protein
MKTIFNIFILLLSLNINSENIAVKSFEIENKNQQISFVNARASALTNRIIRDNSYLFFIDLKEDSRFYKSCWKKFIINRKISIDVKENTHRLVKKTKSSYLFEVYLEPSKIRVSGVSSAAFKNFCFSN